VLSAILINGLLYGGLYALLSVGFSLVFGVARIVNMAHTAFYMLAAFAMFATIKIAGLPLLFSLMVALAIVVVMGLICYRLCFDRIKEHETAVMIVSVGVGLLFQEILLLFFGGSYKGIPAFISGSTSVGGYQVSYQSFLAIGVCGITMIALWLMLTKTMLGIAIRAVAEDREAASLIGLNVSKMGMIILGISVFLAAVAGSVAAPIFMVDAHMWLHPLVTVLAAVILGGLGSIKGSVIGSFILGFAQTAVILLVPGGAYLGAAVSLGIMVVILMIRPEGLFGVAFEEERL
jgi:branched-chain amino acid transport system permease protein